MRDSLRGLCPRPGNDLVASALRGAEPIETLFLLVAERAVKLLERGLHGLHRAQHCIEPLLHRLQAADRGERSIRGALARIYGWFTQGFETQDLKEAQALFEQLR